MFVDHDVSGCVQTLFFASGRDGNHQNNAIDGDVTDLLAVVNGKSNKPGSLMAWRYC